MCGGASAGEVGQRRLRIVFGVLERDGVEEHFGWRCFTDWR